MVGSDYVTATAYHAAKSFALAITDTIEALGVTKLTNESILSIEIGLIDLSPNVKS
jgi:hypothetical protein